MDELAKRFADLAEQYGPKVADAALAAARTEAYSCLAAAAMWLPVVVAMVWAGRWLWVRAGKDDWDECWVGMSISLWLIAGLAGMFIAWVFIDPWTWTTINHPELWIAKKTFHL